MIDKTPACIKAVLDKPGIYRWNHFSGIYIYLEIDTQQRVHQLNRETLERDGVLDAEGWLCMPNLGEMIFIRHRLTFAQVREVNFTRCERWHPEGINSWSSSDWMTAIVGELGELAGLIKMRNRERDGLPGNKFSPTDEQIAKEAADVFMYLDLFCAANGIILENAVVQKFNEVSERVGFPERLL